MLTCVVLCISFLDSNNTDLIRWSDDGRSFIVLDEDEFARTLIPELFKHNNYASFVRQLNMYGFHKTVNITDGSLRQSEKARKGVKPPSMYSHPYFRKNRPDLLWLIQKPAGSSSKSTKRKRDGNMKDPYDSDEGSPVPEIGGPPQQLSAPSTSQDLTQLPRNELAAVRRELQNLQTQQKFISQMITQLKEQNDQFYRQATAFQALHDRHENSINAILTFLATFYNRSLESPGAQNLVNMFTNAMPQSQQQHGSVVEEYNDAGTPVTPSNQVQRLIKRPPLLLPGPASNTAAQNLQPGSAVTEPSSARASVTPPNEISKRGSISSAPPESAQSMTSPAMKSDATTPTNVLNQLPESNDQMMNLINNVNASTNPQASTPNTAVAPAAVDMSSIVDRITQNNSPLTPRQREDMVASLSQNTNNNNGAARGALTAYNSANPAEFKERIGESQHTLDYLQQLQKRQDEKVQELNRRLQPLSPTGTIPGLHDISNQDPFDSLGAPGEYDPAAFINFDDPAPWDTDANADDLAAGAGGEDGDFDFGFGDGNASWGDFDGGGDMFGTANDERLAPRYGADDGDGGRVESVSSEGTSPAGTSMQQDEPGTPSKRVRSQ